MMTTGGWGEVFAAPVIGVELIWVVADSDTSRPVGGIGGCVLANPVVRSLLLSVCNLGVGQPCLIAVEWIAPNSVLRGFMLDRLKSWFGWKPLADEEFEAARAKLLEKTPVPVFWLFGKTGSGKSSIVRCLTGATAAEVGNGFRPQTKFSAEYDFPTAEQPVVRFLDTRGLGEAHYDPAEDIAAFAARAHLVLVVARVADQALEPILSPLKKMRAAAPHRPVILALTCLHEAYPMEQHPSPDPFANNSSHPETLPGELQRLLLMQQERFAGLVDQIVPIDLTPVEEGFEQPQFGAGRLEAALQGALPAAYRQALLQLHDVREQLQDLTERQAWPIILSYSSLAATAAATPLPWADIPVVMGLQTKLVYRLAELYGQKMHADELMKMAGALGGQLLTRFAIRAPLKFLPFVGHTLSAAMAFAYTLSLGKACCWYFGEIKAGHVPTQADLNRVWSDKLADALQVWKRREKTPPT